MHKLLAGGALLGVIVAGSVSLSRAGALYAGAAREASTARLPIGTLGRASSGAFVARSYSENGVEYKYQIFLPQGFNTKYTWPVIISLHSSGEKGSDNLKQVQVGLGPYVRARAASFPAVVIFPQIPAGEGSGRHTPAIRRLIESVLTDVNADPKRIYLTGLSSGGVLAYYLVRLQPGRYAAVVPVSGLVTQQNNDEAGRLATARLNQEQAKALGTTPIWIIHGGADNTAPVANVRETVAVLQAAGVNVKYTEIPNAPHIIWDQAYQTPGLFTWLFAQHR